MKPVYRSNLFMLVVIIGQVIGSIFLSRPLQKFFSYNQFLVVTQILFLLLPVLTYLLVTGLPIKSTLKLNKISLSNIVIIIVIAFVSQPIASFLSALSGLFFENIVTEVLEKMNSISYTAQLGIIALTPAICEELTMRGIILSGYDGVSRGKAAVATGLLFGILHMNPQQFLYAFALGILFGYLVRITNSIFSTMICHFTFNGLQVTLAYLVTKISPEALSEADKINATSMTQKLMELGPLLVLAVVCTYAVILLVKKLEYKTIVETNKFNEDFVIKEIHMDNENTRPYHFTRNGFRAEERIINAPFIAVIIIYVLLMVITEALL